MATMTRVMALKTSDRSRQSLIRVRRHSTLLTLPSLVGWLRFLNVGCQDNYDSLKVAKCLVI